MQSGVKIMFTAVTSISRGLTIWASIAIEPSTSKRETNDGANGVATNFMEPFNYSTANERNNIQNTNMGITLSCENAHNYHSDDDS
jgi:hypothetical protein